MLLNSRTVLTVYHETVETVTVLMSPEITH
jgi:hypothetical protein